MHELRHAIRALWAQKMFTASAVVTLAVGLGANAALYGLLSAALRPLPVPAAGQIVSIAAEARNDQSGGFQYAMSLEAMKDLQERTRSFTDVAGFLPRVGGLATGGKAYPFFFCAVSDNYFSALQVSPRLGALFSSKSGSPVAVVLGHGFWLRHFRGDPNVVGTPVRIDGRAAVVTGVVPASFRGTLMALDIDGYIDVEDLGQISPDVNAWLYHSRGPKPMWVLGRLKPGVTAPVAQSDVTDVVETLGREHPDTDAGLGARVVPEPLSRPMPMRAVAEMIPVIQWLLLALAGLVLLLACLNVANLMLVRASARERELAVRAALGASRRQLVRQMAFEGLLLAMLGAMAGLVVGQWVLHAYVARLDIGSDLPFAFDVRFDWRVFLYSLAAASATGTAIGLWPAWRASRADARAALHEGGRALSDGVERQRLRRLLVVGQIAGSLALLVIAGIFVRSLAAAQRVDLGFDVLHLATVRVDTSHGGYDEARSNTFYEDLLHRVSAWPEVASASYASSVPMTIMVGGGSFYVEGQPVAAASQPPVTFMNHVTHGYFETMQIPIVRGRGFTEEDERAHRATRRVAIVNETMAQKYWPGEDPIGKRLRVYGPEEPLLEVVGVARDSKYVLVFEAPRPFIYIPLVRDESMRTLHVRTKGDPAPILPKLERELAAAAPDLPAADLRTMPQSLAGLFGYLLFRVGAIQAGGLGAIGLTLALVGVYGVVSFGASLRTREIGIRMALGASPGDVLRLILGQGVRLVAIGVAIGLTAALAIGRAAARALPIANAADWSTYASVAIGLGFLALVASYLPARRAMKLPPMTALRYE